MTESAVSSTGRAQAMLDDPGPAAPGFVRCLLLLVLESAQRRS